MDQLRMAAGNQQQEIRKRRGFRDAHGQGVPFQMIDGNKRFGVRHTERLAGRQTDHDAAHKAGAGCRRDRVEIAIADIRSAHRFIDDQIDPLHVTACGDFRDDAAISAMLIVLVPNFIRKNGAASISVAADHRRARVVATCLNAKDKKVLIVIGFRQRHKGMER